MLINRVFSAQMSVSFARLCSDEFRGEGTGKREGAMWAGLGCKRRVAAGSDRGGGGGGGSAAQQPSSLHCFLCHNQCHLWVWGRNILVGPAEKVTRRPIRDPLTLLEFAPIARNACGGLNLANSVPGVLASHPVTVSPSVVSSECDSAFQIRSWPAFLRTRSLAACLLHS